ncbi:MAG: low molecular weight phosphotyrosine protein phosphatase [Acidobacteria bacterium]|nr:low molecular weight phosphotyrosine protein phosphatase [Acidobacteriota bacterium]
MTRILFVCTGNICRSPTAEGVFRAKLRDLNMSHSLDSAATHSYHIGEHPDPRACNVARKRGYPIDDLIVRQIHRGDFDAFDLILAMDSGHERILRRLADDHQQDRIHMYLSKTPHGNMDVPDPYYGSIRDFEHMLDLIEEGANSWLDHLSSQ